MIYAFIDSHKDEFSIVKMCKILGVSKSGYYRWLSREATPLTEKEQKDLILSKKIFQVFVENFGTYGSPRIYEELKEAGYTISQKKIANMMREMNLRATIPKVYQASSMSKNDASYPNVVNRNFQVTSINSVWVADITYIRTVEGWLYLATVMDLCSRKIVGWAMAEHMKESLVIEALHHALVSRNPSKGWIHHSDQGSQYMSTTYIELLKENQAIISASRKGNPYDNACIEAFHATIKKECIYRQKIETIKEAKRLVENYILNFYNVKRRHSTLGYLSPAQFERNLHHLSKNKVS